jgi:hypothetical protein
VRSASVAAIGCVNAIVTAAWDIGAVRDAGAMTTRSGCGSVQAPAR